LSLKLNFEFHFAAVLEDFFKATITYPEVNGQPRLTFSGWTQLPGGPPARAFASSWINRKFAPADSNRPHYIWVMGGMFYDNGIEQLHCDLWRYRIHNQSWTRLYNHTNNCSGANASSAVDYNSLKTYPPALARTYSWEDIDGTLWLFGGVNYNNTTLQSSVAVSTVCSLNLD